MKSSNNRFNSSDDPEFDDFLDLLRSGMMGDDDLSDEPDEDYPDLEDDLGLDDVPDEECPMVSHLADIMEAAVERIGFLGLQWEEDEMIEILELLGYKKSVYNIQIDLPGDMSEDEKEVMDIIMPEGQLDVDIVKKPREKITEDNFRDHRPQEVFNREMKKLAVNFITKLISEGKGGSSDGSRKEED